MTLRLTEQQLKDLGLSAQVRHAKLTPTSTRQHSYGALRGVFAIALHKRFPGVFQPIPGLGIHWGAKAWKLGIQWGGIVRTDDLEDWTILPVWDEDLRTEKSAFSERKLRAVLGRIEEMMHGQRS